MDHAATSMLAPPEQPGVVASPGLAHVRPAQYVRITAILAVFIGLEVTVYYLVSAKALVIALLVGLVLMKVSLAAAYLMGLKFGARFLRRLFVTGLVLAPIVFFIALSTMIFHHSS